MATDRRLHWMNVLFPGEIDFPGNTDGIIAPSGLTAERPVTPTNGLIRYNTSNNTLEAYIGGIWAIIGTSGSVGITTFLGLSDTPSLYPVGTPVLRVNIGQTGVEFADGDAIWLPLAGGTMNGGQDITMNGGTIKGVPSPLFNNDVANKEYVDGIAAGLSAKESVHSATTGPIILSSQGLAGIDGHAAYLDGDRVLVKDQTIPSENGIYAAHAGPWTRTTDMDGTPANEVQGGTTTYVQNGTANGDTNWVVIWDGNVDVDTDPMNWTIISAGGTQNLWETIAGDGGSVSATSPIDTLTIAGGSGISTTMAGTTLTITNDSPNADQTVFGTITGDTGSVAGTASQLGKTIAIIGGTGITTAISGSTITVTSSGGGGSSSRINDTDDNTYVETEQGADDNQIRFGIEVTNGRKVGGEIANWGQNGVLIGNQYGSGLDGIDSVANNSGIPIKIVPGKGGRANPGVSTGGVGGELILRAGNGGYGDYGPDTSGGNGGYVSIRGGYGGSGTSFPYAGQADGGAIEIKAGKGADSGDGGRLDLLAGVGGSGDGATNGGAGGIITIVAGNSAFNNNGGGISITSGSGGNSGTAKGGTITIETKQSNATGVVGPDVTIKTGRGSGAASGNIVLATGYGGIQGAVIIGSAAGYGPYSTELRFREGPSNGTNIVALKAPSSIASDQVWILPDAGQSSPQVLGTDLGEFTLAGLPAAGSYPNCWALVTDASGGRTIVRSDGTNWKVVVVEGATVA